MSDYTVCVICMGISLLAWLGVQWSLRRDKKWRKGVIGSLRKANALAEELAEENLSLRIQLRNHRVVPGPTHTTYETGNPLDWNRGIVKRKPTFPGGNIERRI